MRRTVLIACLAGLVGGLAAGGQSLAQSQFDPYQEIEGVAIVVEGDLMDVDGVAVRLYGIDAPEMGQTCWNRAGIAYDCGMAARNVLQRIAGDRWVTCTLYAEMVSQRYSGICQLNGQDIGELMVRAGWAVSFRSLSNRYERLESIAQSRRRGMWSGRVTRPEIWRVQQRAAENNNR